jgi:hypothetical protein
MPVPGTGKYCVVRDLNYHIGFFGSGLVVRVEDGFLTDLASVPRWAWWLFPPHDPDYCAAAVLHDFLYGLNNGMFTRAVADGVFYEAMRVLGVPKWRAVVMFLAVRFANDWHVDTVGLGPSAPPAP